MQRSTWTSWDTATTIIGLAAMFLWIAGVVVATHFIIKFW